jgi:hypothetical protein
MAMATLEQLESKLDLELLDHLRKRSLMHSQPLGGTPEVQLFAEREELLELPKGETGIAGRSHIPSISIPQFPYISHTDLRLVGS